METRSRTAMDSVEFFTVVIPPCVLCYLTSCLTALGYITFLLVCRSLPISTQVRPICKEIEESNRIRKTRDLFKKIRDIKGVLHAKMGSIKDRNSKDLTETEGIKKRLQEYTENLPIKGLNDLDNHDSAVIHLKPDILECEVKWALGSILLTKLVEVIEFQLRISNPKR